MLGVRISKILMINEIHCSEVYMGDLDFIIKFFYLYIYRVLFCFFHFTERK